MPRVVLPGASNVPVPPLRVWYAVALVILIVVLVTIPPFLWHRETIEQGFLRSCTTRLHAFSNRCRGSNGDEPRIIALGSSLVACGMLCDERMESCVQRERLGTVHFLRLARAKSSVEHFLPVLEQVLNVAPDILLIDADSILYRFQAGPFQPLLGDYADYVRSIARRQLLRVMGVVDTRRELPALLDADFEFTAQQNSETFRLYASAMKNREACGLLPPGHPVIQLLRRARARGIRVVLVEMPRSRQAESVIPTAHLARNKALRGQLERECGVIFLKHPERFPLDRFRDFSHLNQAGAEQFSRWLMAESEKISIRAVKK